MIDGTATACAALAAIAISLVLVRVAGEFVVGHSCKIAEGLRRRSRKPTSSRLPTKRADPDDQ